MSHNRRINYLELPARDLAAVRTFYEKAFGWTFVEYGPDYLAFNDGAMDGGFYRADLACSAERGSALIVLISDDLEQTRDQILASGGRLLKDIFAFPGGRRFHFADPNGNELAVWSIVDEGGER